MNREQIIKDIIPILKKYRVKKAGLFGSYAKNANVRSSDIDLLVELQENISLLDFISIKLALEDKLQHKVDLVEYSTLKQALKKQILEEEVRI